jgi:hypothetical protein
MRLQSPCLRIDKFSTRVSVVELKALRSLLADRYWGRVMCAIRGSRSAFLLVAIFVAFAFPQSATAQTPDLRISEIGSNSYYVDINGRTRADVPVWFELINTGTRAVDTAGYRIKSSAGDKTGGFLPFKIFDLPSINVPPKGVVVLRGKRLSADNEDQDSLLPTKTVAYLGDNSGNYPAWRWSGFIELMRQGKTVDFVRFGASTQVPTTASGWQGDSAAAMPYGQNRFGFALARDKAGSDTNKPSDWTLRHFATPGGPNDVTCNDDADGDGFPDCSEQAGSTYAGLPIYDWGARAGTRDIFIEIDYMLHDQNRGPQRIDDPGTIPQRAALERVRKAFKDKGIAIHFDTGGLYHPASGTSPDDFDLGGGGPVPFKNGLMFGKDTDMTDMANIYDYKRRYMQFARRQVFHYMIFGYTQNSAGESASSGKAELPGNDLMVTLGAWGLNAKTPKARNMLINFQAGTIMHEFGHNLGLRHGGSDHENNKPVYLSVMNYLYQLEGLSNFAGPKAGDRYYRKMFQCDPSDPGCPPAPGCSRYMTNPNDLEDSFEADPANFRIDYSDGSGGSIDEDAISEKKGLGRTGGAPVDFNCDGTLADAPVSFNIDDDPEKTVIKDFNDWHNIKIFFQRTGEGDRSGLSVALERLNREHPSFSIRAADKVLPVAKDKQPLSDEPAPSAAFLKRVKELAK